MPDHQVGESVYHAQAVPNAPAVKPSALRLSMVLFSFDLSAVNGTMRSPGDVRKFAVLMTDGEYNQQYCNGSTTNTTGASIPDRNAGPGNSEKADCTSALGSAITQTTALCKAMMKAGIIV